MVHRASRLTIVTEVKTEEDLVGPGARPGSVPTDVEQATGLERLEILGKMEGVDVFDMRPLDASRRGKLGHRPGDRKMRGQLIQGLRHPRGPHHGPLRRRGAVRRLHRLPGRLAQRPLAHG